ncbi:MAG: hypothetical protein ACOYMA_12295 [Bacteroidia bacterium]
MAIIDESFAWGECYISSPKNANGNLLNEAADNATNELSLFINKYEKLYLEAMFGADLAADMPEELIALIVDYDTKTSPIMNYVYYFYQRSKATVTTMAGEVKNQIINTAIASVQEKMKNAWNEMVDKNLKIHQTLYDTETLEYAIPLSYLNDIYPNIDTEADIFNYCLCV